MPPKNSNAKTILVPGEQQKPDDSHTSTGGANTTATGANSKPADTANAGGGQLIATGDRNPYFEGLHHGETQEQADARRAAANADHEALRAHIREEERAIIRAEEMGKLQEELAQQLQAATTVLAKPDTAAAAAPRSKADYRNMHAHQVDPATLTAPVLTLDGYVCPVAPEKK